MHCTVLLLIISFLANVPVSLDICAVYRVLLWRVKQVKDFRWLRSSWGYERSPHMSSVKQNGVCSRLSGVMLANGCTDDWETRIIRNIHFIEPRTKNQTNIFITYITHTEHTIIVYVSDPWFLFALGIPELKYKKALFPPSLLAIGKLH